jgi:hypothetical protein
MSLVAFPTGSTAGVMDFIHALSGPRMMGVSDFGVSGTISF